MYAVADLDQVIELSNVPQSDVGAPLPHVAASEHVVVLAYLVSEPDPAWDGTYATVVGPTSEGLVATVRFFRAYAHLFGPPNDEAFKGHPLASRGLRPYTASEVRGSSWLRHLEKMNSVHPNHNKGRFLEGKRHFVFAFHDSVFECVAQGFTIEIGHGSLRARLLEVLPSLFEQ